MGFIYNLKIFGHIFLATGTLVLLLHVLNLSGMITENIECITSKENIPAKQQTQCTSETGRYARNVTKIKAKWLDVFMKTEEKRHVAYLKVQKTGSSTIQNIFLRFGYSRNLTFVLPHDDKTLSETPYPNVISLRTSLNDNNIVPPPPGRHYEMVCCHVIYNRIQFAKYLPTDSAYIGSVREPINRVESAIRYLNLHSSISLSEFANNPSKYDKGSILKNHMSFEFGFPSTLFPNSGNNISNYQEEVNLYTRKLDSEFDLIIINERMDESLVYMRRVLRWTIKDVLYLTKNVAVKEPRRFTAEDREKLKAYLYLDLSLYDFAVKRFDEQINKAHNDFWGEVEHFKKVRKIVLTFCGDKGKESIVIDKSYWSKAFIATREDCRLLRYGEVRYIQDIRFKMYGTLNN